MRARSLAGSSIVAATLAAAGCAIGPNYQRPQDAAPAAYKEAGDWITAQPRDTAPKGKWWEVYNDLTLNGLEERVSVSNQNLKAAEARYTQARAAVQSARAGFFPTIALDSSATRARGTPNR